MDTTLTNVFVRIASVVDHELMVVSSPSLSTTLTSRLILNLRDPGLRNTRGLGDNYETSSTGWSDMTAAPTYTLTQIEIGTETTVTVAEDGEEATWLGSWR